MSDPAMDSKEELKKAVEAVKRKTSQSTEDLPVFSPASSPSPSSSLNGSFGGVQLKAVMSTDTGSQLEEAEPTGWTVVDVDWNESSPKQIQSVQSSHEVAPRPLIQPPNKPKPTLAPKPIDVVDADWNESSPKQIQSAQSSHEVAPRPLIQPPNKPKPTLAPKPKPKSPSSDPGNPANELAFPVRASKAKSKSRTTVDSERAVTIATSDAERPKYASISEETGRREMEGKNPMVTSPSASVKSRMSLFESAGQTKPPVYAKPDLSKRSVAPKNPVTDQAISVANPKVEHSQVEEAPPFLPDRHYTDEDLECLNSSPNAHRGDNSKENKFNFLEKIKSPQESFENKRESHNEIVEAGNVKPSSLIQMKKSATPSPPAHRNGVQSRRELPAIPRNPYNERVTPSPEREVNLSRTSSPSLSNDDESQYSEVEDIMERSKGRVPIPPLRGTSLPSASSSPFPSKKEVESIYTQVEDRPKRENSFRNRVPSPASRGMSLSNASPPEEADESAYSVVDAIMGSFSSRKSPYSEVEATGSSAVVEPYYTTDVLRNLPPRNGVETARKTPPKPRPYQERETNSEQFEPPPPHVEGEFTRSKSPIPAPYRAKDFDNKGSTVAGNQRQSLVLADSAEQPSKIHESLSPRSAKAFAGATLPSSSSLIDESPNYTQTPPPLVSFSDAVVGRSYLPFNGIQDGEDVNEISSQDFGAVSSSPKPKPKPKPIHALSPQHSATLNHPSQQKESLDSTTPFSTITPLDPRAYAANAGSTVSDFERDGIDAPPPMDWLDTVTRDERSASVSSVDSMDIAPPPPLHFNVHDPLTFEVDNLHTPPDWSGEVDRNGNVRTITKSSWRNTRPTDFDLSNVPPPPPPTTPVNGSLHYELDLVPSRLSDGVEGLNIDHIMKDLDTSVLSPPERFDGLSDDEDPLPPPPLPPGELYFGVPPPPGNAGLMPLVPPLRKQR